MATVLAGVGIWKAVRDQRKQTALQLSIDSCVGRNAQAFRDALNQIESLNRQILALRAGAAAATLVGATVAGASAVAGLAMIQEGVLLRWKLRQARALLHCGIAGFGLAPLPTLRYLRPPPDPLGPQPLTWTDMPTWFTFWGTTPFRKAAARVGRDEPTWQAFWGEQQNQ